jgi:hypothetical protein
MPHSLAPVLTPHGALYLENLDADFALDAVVADRLAEHFARDGGHGLLQLGAGEAGSRVPPALAFWRGLPCGSSRGCARATKLLRQGSWKTSPRRRPMNSRP